MQVKKVQNENTFLAKSYLVNLEIIKICRPKNFQNEIIYLENPIKHK
jgi:hypothetical protein